MRPDFDKFPDGLVPAIVQDADSLKVLMLGYMNSEAWEITQKQEYVTFYSRSRGGLWTKGETSGHFLRKKRILLDCDRDCILILAEPVGPVCHTGNETCFGAQSETHFLHELERLIVSRKNHPQKDSYTSTLFSAGTPKIAQKVGEEAVELILEAMQGKDELFLSEAADLLFHFLILLHDRGFGLKEVIEVLARRHQKGSSLPDTDSVPPE
ncbi:MAG: bifunctional phosphoribosyl-AMP cyclohydrolase/phosphoribosyl-ATP diphosphatase HisIE [Bacteroidia bacterium]